MQPPIQVPDCWKRAGLEQEVHSFTVGPVQVAQLASQGSQVDVTKFGQLAPGQVFVQIVPIKKYPGLHA
jgi:hypothetical protein